MEDELSVLAGPPARAGTVHLVGAGPGNPGLLTLRAVRLLQTADLIAWDRLAPPEALSLTSPEAELICVGKRKGQVSWSQEDINRLLVSAARAHRSVVRLKGGDPFVFGRGGEEALACQQAGIPFEVVSGVTSAIASATAAGVPVTHRGLSASVTFVSGHLASEESGDGAIASQLDWQTLAAAARGTLVFLMGVSRVGQITGLLQAHGADPNLPAVMVRWATTDRQAIVRGTLNTIADEVREADLRPPATLVIGEVAALHDLLGHVSWPGSPQAPTREVPPSLRSDPPPGRADPVPGSPPGTRRART